MAALDVGRTTVFGYRRSPWSLRLLGGAALLGLGAWLVLRPESVAGPAPWLVRGGGVALALLGGVAIWSWVLLRRMPGDVLRLSPEGLSVGAPGAGVFDVPWPEVRGARVVTVGTSRALAIRVADPERLFAGRDPRSRASAVRATRLYGTPLLVPAGLAAARLATMREAVEAYRAAYGER